MSYYLLFVVALLALAMLHVSAMSADFNQLFQPNWAPDHISTDGDHVNLTLDTISGCGFESKKKYLFGKVSMQVKLVEGDSAGTVTAFYMASEGLNHDEVDFEFLGNLSGEPYLVQTNVYVNGSGNREQRHSLWFDPTSAFHTYSVLWTPYSILFMVDGVPIREYGNKEEKGGGYPKKQGMAVHGSVWNADDWATQGGRVKTDWGHAPFVSSFRAFAIDACNFNSSSSSSIAAAAAAATGLGVGQGEGQGECGWEKPAGVGGGGGLSRHKAHQLRWVRKRHLVYDYCLDSARFSEMPIECIL